MRYILGACALVAGCANPLADMDRLSDVETIPPALDVVASTAVDDDAPAATPSKGLFGGLFAKAVPSATSGRATSDSATTDSATPDTTGSTEAKPVRRARGSLQMEDVTVGASVPYGDIARVCDLPRKALGQQIERAAGYKVYDTNPQSTAPRTFYVTGFSDGCARQFTAALVLVGTPSRHEELRYGQPSDLYPYSQIDRAYEKIKSRVCSVPRGRPCGSRIRQMERDTIFLSTYERFSNNARWADILIHDGDVVAKDIKS